MCDYFIKIILYVYHMTLFNICSVRDILKHDVRYRLKRDKMPGRELPSDLSGERRLFQVGLNRRTQLALKQELDSVTNKTLAEIAAMKQAKLMEPLTDGEITTR